MSIDKIKFKLQSSLPSLVLLVIVSLGVMGFALVNSTTLNDSITQFKENRQIQAKKAAYKKQYREIDWPYEDGSRLKMRIPRKYITRTYGRTKKDPYEWIIMSASYPEFETGYEARNATAPKMLRIDLREEKMDPLVYSNNIQRSAKNDVRRKKAYLYPNEWGLDYYKKIACLENHPNNLSKKFIAKSEPFRDELTPPDCWISFSKERFIPNPNTYSIKYICTPLMQRPDGRGGCTVTAFYKGWVLNYVMRRYMIPEWKTIHEAILGFLDQFVITEPEKVTTED